MTEHVSDTYDFETFVQWLMWNNRCLRASGDEFQHLFERAAKRLWPGFTAIRPYGRIGDRKADGIITKDGTIYQVYSPDDLKQRETLQKIKEDLWGAVDNWGNDLRRWVFVYNTRKRVPPDIPRMLMDQRRKYANLSIEELSNTALWELVRDRLNPQQRAEILGPVPPAPGSIDAGAQVQPSRFMVIHDILSPIDTQDAASAMAPDVPYQPPAYVVEPSAPRDWETLAGQQEDFVLDLLGKSRALNPRFALFSLAPIPLAVHLGYHFSDRVDLRVFQFDRMRRTWAWDMSAPHEDEITVDGLPGEIMPGRQEVIVRVSLSAEVAAADSVEAAGDWPTQVDLRVANPDVRWLCHPKQLDALQWAFHDALTSISRYVPACGRLHLFYAGPTGGAVVIVQAVNPRMTPEVVLYEYDGKRSPRYTSVLTLR